MKQRLKILAAMSLPAVVALFLSGCADGYVATTGGSVAVVGGSGYYYPSPYVVGYGGPGYYRGAYGYNRGYYGSGYRETAYGNAYRGSAYGVRGGSAHWHDGSGSATGWRGSSATWGGGSGSWSGARGRSGSWHR